VQSIIQFHAVLVHFPIALLIAGFICEVISLFNKHTFFNSLGLFFLLAGVVGIGAARLSGLYIYNNINPQGSLKKIVEEHHKTAFYSLCILTITAILRIILSILKKYFGFYKYLTLTLFLCGLLSFIYLGITGSKMMSGKSAPYQNATSNQLNR